MMKTKWPRASIESLCLKVTSGGTPSRANPALYQGGTIPWIKTGELKDWYVDVIEERITESAVRNSSAKIFPPETVLLAMYGDGRTMGSVGLTRYPSATNQACCAMLVNPEKSIPKFLLYSLIYYRPALLKLTVAGAQRNLNGATIKKFEIGIPPLEQQHRIASILSAYDDLIENNTRRIAILEEMARRIYEEWFVHFRFPGHEKVRMVESELGPMPEDWQQSSIGKIAANHDRKRKPLSKMQRESFKGPYPYYGAAKIFDYVKDYIFDGRYILMAEDGSVITSDGFPVLQLANGKFWANNHTHILQGTSLASTEFIYLRLRNEKIAGYITGAAQPKITQENMNRIPVLLPPVHLMKHFTDLAKPKFDLIDVLERKNTSLRATRDLLLPKLISGELDVSQLPEPEGIAA